MIALNLEGVNTLQRIVKTKDHSSNPFFSGISLFVSSIKIFFYQRTIRKTLSKIQVELVALAIETNIEFSPSLHSKVREILGGLKSLQESYKNSPFMSSDIGELIDSNIKIAYKVERVVRYNSFPKRKETSSELSRSLSKVSLKNISRKKHDTQPT